MNENKNTIAITFSTILLFIALVVLIMYLIPKINQLKNLSNQVNSKRIEYETGKLKTENIIELNQMIGQFEQEAKSLGIALPNSPKAEDALTQLSGSAQDSGLKISSAAIQSDSKGNLIISLQTSGIFENQIKFMDKLKSNIRPVKVENMTMEKVGEDIIADFDLNLPFFTKKSASEATNTSATK